jgi:dipeptidyl aminopeptidase/acylaminoacyl peptidase
MIHPTLKVPGRIPLAAVLLLQSAFAGEVATQGMTSQDLRELRSVSTVEFSPDGRQILYGTTHSDRPGTSYTTFGLYDVAEDRHRHLTAGAAVSMSSPRWSPDGQWIGFTGSDGDRRGVMIIRPDGSGLRFLAEAQSTNHPLPGAEHHIAWSPDGKRIAFLSSTPGPETEEADGDPIVIRRYSYKTTGAGGEYFSDNRRLQIHVVDVASGRVTQLTDNRYQNHSLDWSPDGREILFVSNREPQNDRRHNYDLLVPRPRCRHGAADHGAGGDGLSGPLVPGREPDRLPRHNPGANLVRDDDGRYPRLDSPARRD